MAQNPRDRVNHALSETLKSPGNPYPVEVLDEREFLRWIDAARRALKSAQADLERGDYNWACFKAQQAAEFAVKALLHGLGLEAHGHSISALLSKAPQDLEPSKAMRAAKALDKHYVPTRYPNAWPEGSPADYYTREDAEDALRRAEELLEWVDSSWRRLSGGGGGGRR